MRLSHRKLLASLVAVVAYSLVSACTLIPAAAPSAPPALEKSTIKIGLPGNSAGNLPIFLAAERTAALEGLTIEVIVANATTAAQALASDGIDVEVASLSNLVPIITAGQPVRAFYAGFNLTDFAWYARPEIGDWSQLSGHGVGVATVGGLADLLTRQALRKHGLEPERDIRLVQSGVGQVSLQALQSNRVEAVALTAPFTWQAEAAGYRLLGTQAGEIAENWPRGLFFAKQQFLESNPNAIRALLRAHVRAIRLARQDRELGVTTMMNALKYERQDSERAYDEVINTFDERGLLPTQSLPAFWEITKAAGDVTEAWEEPSYLDRRFIDSFEKWAPK